MCFSFIPVVLDCIYDDGGIGGAVPFQNKTTTTQNIYGTILYNIILNKGLATLHTDIYYTRWYTRMYE